MKRILFVAMMMATAFLLTACGAQKTELDIGQQMVRDGDCAGAAPHLDAVIASPGSALNLAHAYFSKGKCAELAENYPEAYKNYYAAKVVGCYAVAHDEMISYNTYARSEYCQVTIPRKLQELEPKIGDKAKIEHIEGEVNNLLTAEYLKRFDKKPQ
ncbi:hypothetical protein [Pseudodesulfovibrio indicus]|uniref:LptM family lipoprotein n=1 Tax=Pseudodesulfovibrio indicus TaxID=1716143 RepID=UPI00292EBEAA|nr:hypothetical protein [Pseudodesulfovibrio indicus]